MTSESRNFVWEEDVKRMKTNGNVSSITTGDVEVLNNIGTQINTINITLQVPDKTVVASIYDAVKNQDCVDELRGADPQQIPAILFKYTRGTKAEQQVIKYDADKNVVRHVDPITGKEVAKDLKKYRNEYLVKNADVYDDTYHIQYMPPRVQRSMRDLSTPSFDSGKKKDKQIPAADVIKMCASGDHRMYKFPADTKKFYTDATFTTEVLAGAWTLTNPSTPDMKTFGGQEIFVWDSWNIPANSAANIDIIQNDYTQNVPAPLPLLGVGAAFGSIRKLRKFSSQLKTFSMG
jgi:hypothetical protein